MKIVLELTEGEARVLRSALRNAQMQWSQFKNTQLSTWTASEVEGRLTELIADHGNDEERRW